MKVEGFLASLRNAETISGLFGALKRSGTPVKELDAQRFLIIIEGDFEGRRFWTEINGERANHALGDAMLNSSSFPFRCRRAYTGGNAIFVKFEDIETDKFLVSYRSEDEGVFYIVEEGRAREITEGEHDKLKGEMPEFKIRSMSEEQMAGMGAFFD